MSAAGTEALDARMEILEDCTLSVGPWDAKAEVSWLASGTTALCVLGDLEEPSCANF